MSKSPENSELLSAYHDGEVPAEERAAAERLLAQAPDARQALEEYTQLSQSLKDVHGSTQSPDLRESVLARVASTEVTRASMPPDSGKKWAAAGTKRTLSVTAGLMGLAAAVTLLLWPAPPAPQRGDAVATNDAPRERQTQMAFSAADAQQDHKATALAAEGRGEPAPAAAASATPAEMEANVALSLEEMTRNRPLPEVGDIVGYLDRNADELTWVAVTVVDVQAAGNQVQLLLTRHGVQSPQGNAAALAQDAQDPGEPLTIVVEADWDQMQAAIADLSDEQFINAMVVNAPSGEDVPQELQGYRMQREPRALANSDGARSGNLQNPELPRAESAAEPGAELAVAEATMANAVQLPATVPSKDLERIAAKRRGPEAPGPTLSEAAETARLDSELTGGLPSVSEAPAPATRFGTPLARPRSRAKMVFVIRKQAN